MKLYYIYNSVYIYITSVLKYKNITIILKYIYILPLYCNIYNIYIYGYGWTLWGGTLGLCDGKSFTFHAVPR